MISRLSIASVAFIPFFLPDLFKVPALLIALFLYFGLGAIAGCAWNSWMSDFVPKAIMGKFYGRRMAMAIAVGAGLSLIAGFGLDLYKKRFLDDLPALSFLFLVGGVAGLVGIVFQTKIPEPRMALRDDQGLLRLLFESFKDTHFKPLLMYLGSWSFAINLAAPFFTIYLLKTLGFSLGWVIGFAVLSQMTNVYFFKVWGRLSDLYSNKSVLAVSGPMFLISIAAWPFTTMPTRYFLTIPLIVLIHVLAGISTAGVNLCASNIAIKLAPKGRATVYLAVNAIVNGMAATIAPILAGMLADFVQGYTLRLTFDWITPLSSYQLPAMNISDLDFLFIFAVIAGLYACHRLLLVEEAGEVEEEIVFDEFIGEMRRVTRHVSSAAGLRKMTYFPYEKLRDILKINNRS